MRKLRYTHLLGIMNEASTIDLTAKENVNKAIENLINDKSIKGLFNVFAVSEDSGKTFKDVEEKEVNKIYEKVNKQALKIANEVKTEVKEEANLDYPVTLREFRNLEAKIDALMDKLV